MKFQVFFVKHMLIYFNQTNTYLTKTNIHSGNTNDVKGVMCDVHFTTKVLEIIKSLCLTMYWLRQVAYTVDITTVLTDPLFPRKQS